MPVAPSLRNGLTGDRMAIATWDVAWLSTAQLRRGIAGGCKLVMDRLTASHKRVGYLSVKAVQIMFEESAINLELNVTTRAERSEVR